MQSLFNDAVGNVPVQSLVFRHSRGIQCRGLALGYLRFLPFSPMGQHL